MSYTRFIDPRLLTSLGRWADCKDVIIEAFQKLGGVDGVMAVTKIGRRCARVLALKLGLIEKGPGQKTLAEIVAEQEKKNLEHLELVWGWKPGQDSVVLKSPREVNCRWYFQSGGMHFKKGDRYFQYTLPQGATRRYLEENGVKYFVAGKNKVPTTDVKPGAKNLTVWVQPQ